MANGSRVSPVMAATAKALDPAQQQAVASYYASLPSPLNIDRLAATAMHPVKPADTGAWLATRGAWDKNANPPPTSPANCARGGKASARPVRWP
ncbi:hypothetical protein G6F58_013343 [Rhizopus delemar]|nr:hypothetical protein G6F58_013343 [Rhizopus delemar]